jgi:hypothetical protein
MSADRVALFRIQKTRENELAANFLSIFVEFADPNCCHVSSCPLVSLRELLQSATKKSVSLVPTVVISSPF